MSDSIFVPIVDYVDALFPPGLVELPATDALDGVWIEPPRVDSGPDQRIATAILLERELALGIPGLDCIQLVFAPGQGGTVLLFEAVARPTPLLRMTDAPLVLRVDTGVLRPAVKVDQGPDRPPVIEADPDQTHLDITLGHVSVSIDLEGNLEIDATMSIDLPLCLIGDTGAAVEATGIRFHSGRGTPPPGRLAGWRGIHVPFAALHLPGELAGTVGQLEVRDATIGNGGFSGGVASTWTPAHEASLAGYELELAAAQIEFVQNVPVTFELEGTLTVPFFDEPVDVALSVGADGRIGVSVAGDLAQLHKPGIVRVDVHTLGFEFGIGHATVSVSGMVTPEFAGFTWPSFAVKELCVDSEGNVHLDGGWLDLPDQYSLDLSGFQLEITRLGFGRDPDGGRWIGLNGGLQLVAGLPAGASVDGLRLTWYPDGTTAMSLDGVGVDLTVPDVLELHGAVSFHRDGREAEFRGRVTMHLVSLDLRLDGRLVVGFKDGHRYSAVYLDAQLPAGIPLFTTGLALYGISGLYANQMEPDRGDGQAWYSIDGRDSWYHEGEVGVAALGKWGSRAGSMAFGAGVTLGTVPDNGYAFSGRVLLVIVFPGPILMLEGGANLLKPRNKSSEEPLFRALAVLDGREGTLQVGLDARYRFDAAKGRLIDLRAGADAFFAFHDPTAWFIHLGRREPRDQRVAARLYSLFDATAYLMLDANRVELGASVGFDQRHSVGPLSVSLEAWMEAGARISWRPPQFAGELSMYGSLELSAFGFAAGVSARARLAADVWQPYHILGEVHVAMALPWPLPDVEAEVLLEWGPAPTAPALPLPLQEVAMEHMKATSTWPLQRHDNAPMLLPDYDDSADGLREAPKGPSEPAGMPGSLPVVPLDGRLRLTFASHMNDDALVGVNAQPGMNAQPDRTELIGDPSDDGRATLQARYGLRALSLQRQNDRVWEPVATTSDADGLPRLFGSWAPVPSMSQDSSRADDPSRSNQAVAVVG